MPDTYDLEALVRAARPAPDPDWAARLDGRAARFADAPAWYARPVALMRGHLVPLGALAGLLMVVVVGAVTLAQRGDRSGSPSAGSGVGGSASSDEAAAPAPSAKPAPAAPPAPESLGPAARAVRRSAELTLSTTRTGVERVSDEAIRVTDELGGFVQSSSVSAGGGGGAGAELVLRIPSARLPQALSRLSQLARVKQRTQEAEDLTDQRSVLRARVTDARAERDGLRRRLARAETDAERARLRGLLQRAEQLVVTRRRRVAALAREVSYATVGVQVDGDRRGGAAPPPAGRWTPGDALRDAARVLEVSLGVLVIALAVLAPLGLVAVLAALAGRLVVRRRRERALEPA